jgi:endonuclease YncB( thermonuclease family)
MACILITHYFTDFFIKLFGRDDETPKFDIVDRFRAKIVHVRTGDSCDAIFFYRGQLRKFRLRLTGYVAVEKPALSSLSSSQTEKSIYLEEHMVAKKRLEDHILQKFVYVDCEGFGVYGNLLAKIYLDSGESVNELMSVIV